MLDEDSKMSCHWECACVLLGELSHFMIWIPAEKTHTCMYTCSCVMRGSLVSRTSYGISEHPHVPIERKISPLPSRPLFHFRTPYLIRSPGFSWASKERSESLIQIYPPLCRFFLFVFSIFCLWFVWHTVEKSQTMIIKAKDKHANTLTLTEECSTKACL